MEDDNLQQVEAEMLEQDIVEHDHLQDASSENTSLHTNIMSSPSQEITDHVNRLMERQILDFEEGAVGDCAP